MSTSGTSALPKRTNFAMPDLSRSSGGMSFDYNAPAELFLSKPAKGWQHEISPFRDSG
jgi:hypothetical protein